ncbi:hypothetical protein LBMAG53_31570 [Planctomycetota bacterium]|nr:hypothetical protein LBMAG53_31570 [Planctomycetota bacterium]
MAIQVAEAVLAGINGGIDGIGYWTFSDFPDNVEKEYTNKWGAMRWSDDDHSARDLYYGVALLTRNLRGPSAVLKSTGSDGLLRITSVRQQDGALSIAVLNRRAKAVPVRIGLGTAVERPFRRFHFDPAHPPRHPFADLPPADGLKPCPAEGFTDEIPGMSLAVYTTDYEDMAPSTPAGVTVAQRDGHRVASWQAVPDKDLCYYRVFCGDRQVGSTIATELVLPADANGPTTVRAVDDSGNVSP